MNREGKWLSIPACPSDPGGGSLRDGGPVRSSGGDSVSSLLPRVFSVCGSLVKFWMSVYWPGSVVQTLRANRGIEKQEPLKVCCSFSKCLDLLFVSQLLKVCCEVEQLTAKLQWLYWWISAKSFQKAGQRSDQLFPVHVSLCEELPCPFWGHSLCW